MSDVDTAAEATTDAAPPMEAPQSSVADEIAVIKKVTAAVDTLDRSARRRVLAWLADRYQLGGEAGT